MAEEDLLARAAAVHPHLAADDQRAVISRLTSQAGVTEAPRKPTKADLASIGLKVQ
jgi:hypothetical protein